MNARRANLQGAARRQVENRLLMVDRVLRESGLWQSERQNILDDLHTQILEMLAEEGPGEPSAEDVRAVLARLDPPDFYGAASSDGVEESDAEPVDKPCRSAGGDRGYRPSWVPVVWTCLAAVLGIFFVLWGFRLLGGHPGMIFQPVLWIMVVGGSGCAVLVQFKASGLLDALRGLKGIFFEPVVDVQHLVSGRSPANPAVLARRALRQLNRAVSPDFTGLGDSFYRRGQTLADSGLSRGEFLDMATAQTRLEKEAWSERGRVWLFAGIYLLAFGLLTFLLCWVVILGNLADPEAVGHGLSAAISAFVYGLFGAFLICFPLAGRMYGIGRKLCVVRDLAVRAALLDEDGATDVQTDSEEEVPREEDAAAPGTPENDEP